MDCKSVNNEICELRDVRRRKQPGCRSAQESHLGWSGEVSVASCPDLTVKKRLRGVGSRGQECSDRRVGVGLAYCRNQRRPVFLEHSAGEGFGVHTGRRPLLDPGTALVIG